MTAVEPFCRIEWHGDGRQQIRLFDGAGLSEGEAHSLCREIAMGSADTLSVGELKHLVSDAATRHELRAQWLEGGHDDPLDQVAAFTFWRLEG